MVEQAPVAWFDTPPPTTELTPEASFVPSVIPWILFAPDPVWYTKYFESVEGKPVNCEPSPMNEPVKDPVNFFAATVLAFVI